MPKELGEGCAFPAQLPIPVPTFPRPNATKAAGPCLHQLFERRAAENPDADAVVFQGRRLTYGELNRRANAVAFALRARGVRSNDLVGLCAERSLEMVVGLVGILKAGAAYVPLDPSYPAERLALMLDDARPPVVVVQPHLRQRLPCVPEQFLELDLADSLEGPDGPALFSDSQPSDLTYVIFTSGSTGRPKGVLVSHANVVALFEAARKLFDFDANDVWTLFHSFAFDFSVWELWGALLYGGKLVVVPYDVSRSPHDFLDLLRGEGVTVLNQTPSAFRMLVRAEESLAEPADLALRWVIFGGEALPLPILRPWFERHGDQRPRLVNMYGITETTVHVTFRPLAQADLVDPAYSPIGQPLPGWTVHLLDAQRRPVPDGEIGEIYVGGDGVARGYLNRPELTAQRFLPDPFAGRPGARLYKSGDLAKRMPGGDLAYLGRSDHQVKIRGFRIELVEVETVLARHPGIRAATVLAREDAEGDKRLIAYVVPRGASGPTARELRGHLLEHLPDYAVPAAAVFLDRLPLTTNGKVDRAALPPPPESRPTGTLFVAPRDEQQRRLQHLWEEVLHVRPVGIDDDFFELGGDSQLAVHLCGEVNQAFGAALTPSALLQHPTIEGLAGILKVEQKSPSCLVPLQPHGNRPPFFCVHPLGGDVFCFRKLSKFLDPDQPFFGLQAPEAEFVETEFARLEDMAARYVADVIRAWPKGPYYLGGYSMGAFVALEMAQQMHQLGRRVAFLAMLDDGPSLTYGAGHWGPRTVAAFLANLPRWLREEGSRLGIRGLLAALRRKLGSRRRRGRAAQADAPNVEDVVDLSAFSTATGRIMAAHYRALMAYQPRLYAGRITLFRARVQSMSRCPLPDLGWGALASDGMEIHVVPGGHYSMLLEPNVPVLGELLSDALLRVSRIEDAEGPIILPWPHSPRQGATSSRNTSP
jgi:amino acid adenylation domain-containing protein